MPLQQREIDEAQDTLTIAWSLAKPASAVWTHLTDPARLTEWLGDPQTFDARPGGEIRIDHGDGYVCRSIVKRVEPADYLFGVTWQFPDEHPTLVEVRIQPSADATSVLTLRHYDLGELRDSYADGWVTHLTFFEASLNGTPLPVTEFWNLHATIVALGKGISKSP